MKKLRNKIDEIDNKIIELLDERVKYITEIKEKKLKNDKPVYSPAREKEIKERIKKYSPEDGFPLKAKINIFNEIFAASRAMQKELTISFLGPRATFTHLAATRQFSEHCKYKPVSGIELVFNEVEKGRADYGVVPVENTTEGIVSHTLDMFIDSNCKITDELLMEISQNLLSREKSLDSIEKIYSHPQAFAQCRKWLEENIPSARIVQETSTAAAAERASREDNSAAIASVMAASLYGLNIISESIEDIRENITRFYVIGKDIPVPSGDDKTTIMFSVKDKVGALHDMLIPFKTHSINLTKIESRPSKNKAWEYIFFVDFEGHIENPQVKKALKELEKDCVYIKVLGSYPAASNTFGGTL
ncbi:MAG: prephenate dehydratase [Elusimicrobiota bacterium]